MFYVALTINKLVAKNCRFGAHQGKIHKIKQISFKTQINHSTIHYQIIYGTYCECDNFSCERHEGLLCSGPDHGKCECGKCVCLEGWTGSNCACQESTDTCIPPGGGPLCSGHGTCKCGACECESTEEGGRYRGKYCDKCPVSIFIL